MWWEIGGLVAGFLAAWVALVVVLYRRRPDDASIREALRLLPDVVRLVKGLATDRAVPLGSRMLLWMLLAFLLSPVDLIPDVIPVIGIADDVVLTALVLRNLVQRAGVPIVERHWPGSEAGLRSVLALAGRAAATDAPARTGGTQDSSEPPTSRR